MKTKMMCFFILLIGYSITARSQTVMIDFADSLPGNITVDISTTRTYKIITDYYDYDIHANFIKKARISGDLTCDPRNDSVKWNNVYISESDQLNNPFPGGTHQMALENFTYLQSGKIMEDQFFSGISNIDFRLKNLFWDMMAFDVFVYPYWDSLKFNTVFNANAINGEVNMANNGTFENKEIQLKWIGVTKIDGELCAIIKYSQMNGKIDLGLEHMSMTGRSHYWGEIYVSLRNKQIEYATLTEDVLTDVLLKGQNDNVLGYSVRKITLEKTYSNEKK